MDNQNPSTHEGTTLLAIRLFLLALTSRVSRTPLTFPVELKSNERAMNAEAVGARFLRSGASQRSPFG